MASEEDFADLGERFLAILLDSILLIGINFVFGALIGFILASMGQSSLLAGRHMFFQVFGFFSMIFYFTLMEGLYGQSLGKKALSLTVIKENGDQCDMKGSAIRNVMRIIDGLPIFYIVGIISIVISDSDQRLGDLAAKTYVVKNK